MKKISLHFGVNHFDVNYYGEGNDLQGCENDAIFMEKVASERGFQTNLFLSKDATYKTYVDFMNKMALELQSGDIFLFSGSFHGTYSENGATAKEKRKTAICLHDKIVWDSETKKILTRFKPGVTVVWMIDCCHSRDNFKSLGNPHTGKARFLPFEKILKSIHLPEETKSTILRCNIVAYSSSTEFQVSYDLQSFIDKRPMGLFTASLEKVWSKAENKNLNYVQFYDKLTETVEKKGYPQTPKLQIVNGAKEKITRKQFLV